MYIAKKVSFSKAFKSVYHCTDLKVLKKFLKLFKLHIERIVFDQNSWCVAFSTVKLYSKCCVLGQKSSHQLQYFFFPFFLNLFRNIANASNRIWIQLFFKCPNQAFDSRYYAYKIRRVLLLQRKYWFRKKVRQSPRVLRLIKCQHQKKCC